MEDKEGPILPVNIIAPHRFKQTSCLDKLVATFRNKTKLFWSLLLLRLAVLCWFIYVNARQLSLLYFYSQAPNGTEAFVSEEEFEQARMIHLFMSFYSVVGLQLDIILTFVITFFNVLPWVWTKMTSWLDCLHSSVRMLGQHFFVREEDDEQECVQEKCSYFTWEIEKSMAFVLVLTPFIIAPIVLQLPLNTISLFISVVLFTGFSMAMTGVIVFILQNGGIAMKWLYIWLLLAIVPIVLSDVFFPLLEKRSSISGNETEAYEEISRLASRVGFPVSSIYVSPDHHESEDGSDQNAYYGGTWLNQRIVLTQSIFSHLTSKEITAVMGHEIGHWKLGHIFYRFVFVEANIILLILLFHRLYRNPALYKAFGFYDEQPILAGFLIFSCFIVLPYKVLVSMAGNWLSQFGEYKADAFAATFGLGEYLCSALLKMGANHTLPMDDDWLYSLSQNAHPSTWNRCAVLKTN